ncbi:hypothetical protein E8E12_007242 [Didymella heteroderae]|uniref:Uncharacterized protein n=1 Tax=Didymella heteroderae TaxID=1769908 RepID=A0A9P5C7C3_9PLEO|nr:hypothetical protein E8E12_007242 [Didymella heteroderae]
MRTAVLHTTILYLASEILGLYLNTNMLEYFQEDPAVQNLMALAADNSTYPDPPSMALTYKPNEDLTLWSWHLPRTAVVVILISTLQYYWMAWLERVLPSRPRRRGVVEPVDGEGESDIHEEKIVKRWIAQGRVKRASLNWFNTFLKWVLELTIGRLWYHAIEHALYTLLELQHPRNIMLEINGHIAMNFFGAYTFSMAPLATLIAFAVLPAHQQMVFIAGADLMGTVFVTMLVRVFAGWVVKTGIVQGIISDMTNHAKDMIAKESLDDDPVLQDILSGLRLRTDEL